MRYMLDTDSCIALIKRKSGTLLRRLTALGPGKAGISAITLSALPGGTFVDVFLQDAWICCAQHIRGFCPSCHAKRLAEWGDWMRKTLLLEVPHRQVV
jgi:hypothetical protein